MKKIITAVAAVIISSTLFQNVSMAACTATVQNGKIAVSGSGLTAGANVNITAFPTGVSSDNAEYLMAFVETEADKDGIISVEFGIRADKEEIKEAQSITVYVKEEGQSNPETLTVSYSVKAYNSFVDIIKAASKSEIAAAFENGEFAETMQNLGMDSYLSITSTTIKEDIVKFFEECLDRTDITPTKLAKSYAKAYNTALLNVGEINASDALASINPKFDNVSYNDITDEELKKWLASQATTRKYDSIADFESEYAIDNILYIINNSNAANIYTQISKYANALGIEDNDSYKSYSALGITDKGKVSYALTGNLTKNPVKGVSGLTSEIKTALDSISSGNSSGGSSGGSTGGSSGGGKTVSVPLSMPSQLTNEATGGVFKDLSDVPWASGAIENLYKKGIVHGVSDTQFNPYSEVTREQFVKMAVLAAGIPQNGTASNFDDVDKNEWYYGYISAGVNAGMIYGKSDTIFGIGSKVTRQDAAVILHRAANYLSMELKNGEKKNFTDSEDIADYAQEAVEALSSAGIIEGDDNGEFKPLQSCTRAQAAVIINRMFFDLATP